MAIVSNITQSDEWYVGEDKTINIDVNQADGTTAQTMTGWALKWTLSKSRTSAAVITKTTSDGISIVNGDGTDDRAQIVIADTDTDNLSAGIYRHALWRTDDGSESLLSRGTAELQDAGGN